MFGGKKRQKVLDQFTKGANGKYVYTGSHYAYAGERPWNRLRLIWLGLALIPLLITLGMGLLPVPGLTFTVYILLPYVAALLFAAWLLYSAARLLFWRLPLRAYIYDETVAQIPLRGGVTAFCSALSAVGEVIYLAVSGLGLSPLGTGFVLAELLAAVSAAALWRVVRRTPWEKK